MREIKFILPFAPDAEPGVNHGGDYAEAELLNAAGGFTVHEVFGAWLDEDRVKHTDKSLQFTVAIDEERVLARVYAIAIAAARMNKQQALYWVNRDGETEIISLGDAPSPATSQLPQVGEIWDTICGARVAITSVLDMWRSDGSELNLFCVVLQNAHNPGPGNTYRVDAGGRYQGAKNDSGANHPLSLCRFVKRFDD